MTAPTAAPSLMQELKRLVVSAGNLHAVDPESLDEAAPLYGAGLGLDSIDLLEVIVQVERRWGLKVRNDDVGRQSLANLRSLAAAIVAHRDLRASSDQPKAMPLVETHGTMVNLR